MYEKKTEEDGEFTDSLDYTKEFLLAQGSYPDPELNKETKAQNNLKIILSIVFLSLQKKAGKHHTLTSICLKGNGNFFFL